MPRSNIRKQLFDYKYHQLMNYYCNGTDNNERRVQILDEMYEDLVNIVNIRPTVPKPFDWRNNILGALDNTHFLQMLRVSKAQFGMLINLFGDDTCFWPSIFGVNMPVELQFSIALFRLGASGESASTRKIATVFGIRNVATIDKITDRVFAAIMKKCDYINWPSAIERAQIVGRTFQELPFCIGYMGTNEIVLAAKPVLNTEAHLSRNRVYSTKLQVVCDNKLRIRNVVVGNPGGHDDARIYEECQLYKDRDVLFTDEQWIAGSAAYSLSTTLITPYGSNEELMDKASQEQFNRRHSQYWDRVDSCFAGLKEKFCSLKELHLLIKDTKSNDFLSKWLFVCCILYNILLPDSDAEGDDKKDDFIPAPLTDGTPLASSEDKRRAIYDYMKKMGI